VLVVMNLLKNLKNMAPRLEQHDLVGRQIAIGPYHVTVDAKLAEGGFASIFQVRELEKGTLYALKRLRVQGNPEALEEVKVEARVMHQLRGHPHVLKLIAVAITGPKGGEDCLMLLELCQFSLVDAARKQQLDPCTSLEAFHGACKAVQHMHSQNPPLTHRCGRHPHASVCHLLGYWPQGADTGGVMPP